MTLLETKRFNLVIFWNTKIKHTLRSGQKTRSYHLFSFSKCPKCNSRSTDGYFLFLGFILLGINIKGKEQDD